MPARCASRGRDGGSPPGRAVPRSPASRAATPKARRRCARKTVNGSGCEEPLEQAEVDFAQGLDCGEIDMLVDLVNRGVHRTELDDFATDVGHEAPVRCSARRADLGYLARDVPDRSRRRIDQLAARREIRHGGEGPVELLFALISVSGPAPPPPSTPRP